MDDLPVSNNSGQNMGGQSGPPDVPPVAGPTSSPQQLPQPVPTSPPSPVSGGIGGKEREMMGVAELPVELPKVPEEILDAEVKEAGVEVRPTTIELPRDLKKLGVQPGAGSMPVIHHGVVSTDTAALPLSDSQIMAGEKVDTSMSLKWLAVWCVRQLLRAGISLRLVKGKIFRVKVEEIPHGH